MVPRKSTLAALFFATALVSSTASAAFAGEVNGNGKDIPAPDRASSICAFSGQNDEPLSPTEGGRVQSYGQLVQQGLKDVIPSPGVACRGNN